jgi:hypothetical protein
VPIERLAAGQAFHRAVQSAFLSGLAGGSGFKERHWRLVAGGRGRVDLAVEVDGREQMLVIIEIKGTDWDTILAARIMRNLAVIFASCRPTLAPPSRRWKQASGLAASWELCYTLLARPAPRPSKPSRTRPASRPSW